MQEHIGELQYINLSDYNTIDLLCNIQTSQCEQKTDE